MALWTPQYLTTALWLDAADGDTLTLESGAVSQWSDKSGNERHATQATADSRPTLSDGTLNNLDELEFATDFLNITGGLLVTADMTVVSVFRRATAGISSYSLGGSVANGPPYDLQWYTDNVRYSGLGSTGYATHGAAATATGVFISALWRNRSTTALAIDGTAVGTAQTALAVGSVSLTYVGRRAAQYHNGRLAEIVAVAAELSTGDRQRVEGYLAHKWGLTASLPSDHPYKTDAPLAAGVSGIIRDRNGDPCQRKVYLVSRPTDTTAPTIVAHGLSDATTGAYDLVAPADEEVTRVVVSEDDAEPLLNDLVDRVIPA